MCWDEGGGGGEGDGGLRGLMGVGGGGLGLTCVTMMKSSESMTKGGSSSRPPYLVKVRLRVGVGSG